MSKELRGIPAARGLARGVSRQWKDTSLEIPSYAPTDLGAEKARLIGARQEALGDAPETSRPKQADRHGEPPSIVSDRVSS